MTEMQWRDISEARRIITNNVYPPIPIRSFDWCAYFDGDEEAGRCGWGVTEEAAIKDLKQRFEDESGDHQAQGGMK